MKQPNVQFTEEFQRCIEAVNAGENLFITGKAGTGKSTLLRHICENQKSKKLAVVAPTGVAALNVDGETIHKCFAFRPDLTAALSNYRPPSHLRELDLLVIDEVSMAKADLIDMVDCALKRAKKKNLPFGGVQLVLVGDLFQLPPVEAEDSNTDVYYATPFFFSSLSIGCTSLVTIELTTVFRQKDEQFVAILNAIRDGSVTSEQLDAINRQCVRVLEASEENKSITLAARNSTVLEINTRQLLALSGEEKVYPAEKTGEADAKKFKGLEQLCFKVGARVMMLVNQNGYVNGSLGRIRELSNDRIVVEVEGVDEPVQVERYTWRMYDRTRKNEDGTNIEIGTFSQFPLNLAWAVTVHKSQGKTFDRVVFDPSYSSQDGQTYVALSRCTSLGGLILKSPITAKHVKVSVHVLRFHRNVQTSTTEIGSIPKAFVGVVTTGNDRYRKLAEVAVIRHDSCGKVTTFTTLINPHRDLCDAAHSGLAASEMTLCPDLSQAKAIIAIMLSGTVPIGFHVNDLFLLAEWSEAEVQEGVPIQLASPEEASPQDLAVGGIRHAARNATSLAELAKDHFSALNDQRQTAMRAAPFLIRQSVLEPNTYVVGRGGCALTPMTGLQQILNGLDRESQRAALVGLSVGANLEMQQDGTMEGLSQLGINRDECTELASSLYKTLVEKAEHDGEITEAEASQIGRFIALWNLPFEVPQPQIARKPVEFKEGMRVCLTGKAVAPSHPCHGWTKKFVKEKAEPCGLRFVEDVKKGDAPDVVALLDIAQESNKAEKARGWGIPVVTWRDIVEWSNAMKPPNNIAGSDGDSVDGY